MDRPKISWSENVILVDSAFLDSLVQDFIVNFERMINRPLGKLNLCHWLDCLLLDIGLGESTHDNFVAFLHPLNAMKMSAVEPGNYKEDLTEKAFKDRLGEFTLDSFPIEKIVSTGEFVSQALKAAMESEATKQILVVGDFSSYGEEICKVASEDSSAKITLFGMTPLPEGKYKQQVLGYSVMSALGIKAEEL